MSPAPGVISSIGEDILQQAIESDETPFVVGLALKGSVDEPTLITSRDRITPLLGDFQSYSPIYDFFDVAFREGPASAVPHFFIRAVGPAAKAASKKIKDGEEEVLEAVAISPGEWGNDIDFAIEAGVTPSTFHVLFSYKDDLKERSPELSDVAAAVAWAEDSDYCRLKALGTGDPDVQSVALTGGDDDRENVDDEVIAAQLAKFKADLGFGPVVAPGFTDEAVHKVVQAHADATERLPVLDLLDSDDEEDQIGDVGALRSADGHKQAASLAPWEIAPGRTSGTTRTVPPSARFIGQLARIGTQSGNPNLAAAGPERGRAQYVIGLTQSYDEAQHEALNDAGVIVSLMESGRPVTMGWRTLANPVTEKPWLQLNAARTALWGANKARRTLRKYLFDQLDADGDTRSRAEGRIINEVHDHLRKVKAVYASGVTVRQEVNPDDGSVGKLIADQWFQPTKHAEVIELTTAVSSTDI